MWIVSSDISIQLSVLSQSLHISFLGNEAMINKQNDMSEELKKKIWISYGHCTHDLWDTSLMR